MTSTLPDDAAARRAPGEATADQFPDRVPEDVPPTEQTPDPNSDDRAALTPICGEGEFDELVDEMVADEAPRMFAVVQTYDERVDGWVAGWGLAFEDRVEVISVEGRLRVDARSPERAARWFAGGPYVSARVVWAT